MTLDGPPLDDTTLAALAAVMVGTLLYLYSFTGAEALGRRWAPRPLRLGDGRLGSIEARWLAWVLWSGGVAWLGWAWWADSG